MLDQNLDHFLAAAVTSVLETMFFSEALGPCDPSENESDLRTRLAFSGEVSGYFAVRICGSSARSMAASFLGEIDDLVTETQTGEAICELTNILCGSVLSKLGCRECFDLGSPELLSAGIDHLTCTPACQQSFAVEKGTMTVSLFMSASA
ncbi:MAG TPA: chemotaxis protein CheX [Terracidiphilus sp.]|jgi:CheY-specific phosphatase CheX